MELNEYLRTFKSHWVTIVATVLVCLAGAFAVNGLLTRTFEANALIFITTESNNSSSYENSQFTMQRVKSYPSLVDSPAVLNPTIKSLGLDMSLGELRGNVSATNPTDTVYVQVTAASTTARGASDLANTVAKYLTKQIQSIDSGSQVNAIKVLPLVAVPAVEPTAPSFPSTKINLALGALVGLSAGLLIAIIRSKTDRKVYGREDIGNTVGLSLIGGVVRKKKHEGLGMTREKSRKAANVDPYFELWTNIVLKTNGRLPGVVLLVPAGPGAVSKSRQLRRGIPVHLSNTGYHVCYVESDAAADLAFEEIAEQPGLMQILSDQASATDTARIVKDTAITVIPSGGKGLSMMGARATRQSATVVKQLADEFDVVFLQSSLSHGPMSATIIAPVADAVVIVAAHGATTRGQLRQTALELKSVGVKPLGVVMVDMPKRRDRRAISLSDELPWPTE